MDGGWLLVLSFSRRFFFQLFFLWTNIPVHLYSPLRVLRRSIPTAVMRPFFILYKSLLREITLRCCERLHFDVARDYISIWIIQPAVRFYRRYEWTAEVYSFSRRFFFQLFFLAMKHPRLILLSATSSPLSPVYSYGAYASLPFFILYKSMLREITIQCCERLQIIVARDYNSMLREITIQCCERLHFIITRDYNSMLREITLVFELYNPP